MITHLLWPDTHVPYEDKRAFQLVLKVAKAVADRGVIMGDFSDFYTVSSHNKDPNRHRGLELEVDYTNGRYDDIQRVFGENVTILEGNHEKRLTTYLTEKAPELFNMVKAEKLFRVKERGWQWVPYMKSHRIGRLHLTHDVGFAGARAHTQSRQAFEGNVAIGHTHRLAAEYVGNSKGSSHVGIMLGWLGDKNAIDYMHTAKVAQWHLGFGMAYEDTATKNVHVVPVPIIDYTCVVNGKLFKA